MDNDGTEQCVRNCNRKDAVAGLVEKEQCFIERFHAARIALLRGWLDAGRVRGGGFGSGGYFLVVEPEGGES